MALELIPMYRIEHGKPVSSLKHAAWAADSIQNSETLTYTMNAYPTSHKPTDPGNSP